VDVVDEHDTRARTGTRRGEDVRDRVEEPASRRR
jgi:hypothetical protein